jgi:hypothetical protein
MIYLKGFETFLENKKEVTCSYYDNLKPSPNRESFFKNLTTDQKKKVLKEAGNILGKSKKELIGWYKNPETIKKFDDEEEFTDWLTFYPQLIGDALDGEVISDYEDTPDLYKKWNTQEIRESLDEWINSLKCIVHFNKSTSDVPNVWGYYSSGKKYVYVNLYEFYSNDNSGRENLVNVIRHEIMHAIDWFLQSWSVKTYDKTHPSPKDQDEYNWIYNINDKDQFARLQNFRFKFGIKPIDNAKSIGNKLIQAFKSGKIKSDAWKFDLYNDSINTYFVFIPKETKVVYTPQLLKEAFARMKEVKMPIKTNLEVDQTSVRKSNLRGLNKPTKKSDTFKFLLNKKNSSERTDYIYNILYQPTNWNIFKDEKSINDRFSVGGSNDFESLQLFSNFSTDGWNYPKEGGVDVLVFVNLNTLTEFNNQTVKVDNKEDVVDKTA